MTMTSYLGIVAAVLYLVSTSIVWQQLRCQHPTRRALFVLTSVLAVCAHGAYLYEKLVFADGIYLGFFPMASIIAGTGAAIVTLASLYRRLEWVSALVFPLSIVFIFPLLWLPTVQPSLLMPYSMGIHVLLSVLAVALFTTAAAQALLLLFQHKQLKRGRFGGPLSSFPPMETMETMLFELLWATFLLLTATIATGFLYLDDLFAQHVAHKTLLTIAAWALLAILLSGRHLFGWRALRAIRLTLLGFTVLVVAFFGSQFVLQYVVAV